MKIIDISWPLFEGMTEYRDKNTVRLQSERNFEEHDVRLTHIAMSNHTGTHVDAGSHFIKDGKTIDQYDLNQLCGKAKVIDCTQVEKHITADDLKDHEINEGDIILFKTKNSALKNDAPFNHDFIFVETSAAEYLRDKKIKAVGLDYPGFEFNQDGHPSHHAMLDNDIPIIEGLRLAHVEPGEYFLICLPLAFQGIDGAPARAILIQESP